MLVAAEETVVQAGNLLLQYGPLGVFAGLLVWFARVSYNRETARSDRLEQEVLRLNTVIQEKVIPALMSATGAVEESTELLRDLNRERYARWTEGRSPTGGDG